MSTPYPDDRSWLRYLRDLCGYGHAAISRESRSRRARPQLEPLETRSLLSVTAVQRPGGDTGAIGLYLNDDGQVAGTGFRFADPDAGRDGRLDAFVWSAAGGSSTIDSGAMRMWDAASGAELVRLAAHPGGITGLAFSPDGHLLGSAGVDGSLRLWDGTPGS